MLTAQGARGVPLGDMGWAGAGFLGFTMPGEREWASRIEWTRHYLIGGGRGCGDFNAKARGRKEGKKTGGAAILLRVLRDSVVNWHGGCSCERCQPARKELERR